MESRPGPRLDVHHVGVAVPSIDEALGFYREKLGLDVVDRRELPDRQLSVAFVQAGNTLIELLEPTDPDTTVARFLERRGPGQHHLCYRVPDLRAALADLARRGYELIDPEPRTGAHGHRVAFLHPRSTGGVLTEIVEPAGGH